MDEKTEDVNAKAIEDLSASPKKKSKSGRLIKVILGVVVSIGLLIGLGIYLIINSTNDSVEAAEDFAQALFTKDYQRAYDYFHPSLIESQTFDQFAAQFTNAPLNESCLLEVTGRAIDSDSGSATVKTVTGNLVCGEEKFPAEMRFIEENGAEKLILYQLN